MVVYTVLFVEIAGRNGACTFGRSAFGPAPPVFDQVDFHPDGTLAGAAGVQEGQDPILPVVLLGVPAGPKNRGSPKPVCSEELQMRQIALGYCKTLLN